MQMIWKNNRKRPRPPLSKASKFQSPDDDDDGLDLGGARTSKEEPVANLRSQNWGENNFTNEFGMIDLSEKLQEEGNRFAEEGKFAEALGKWEAAITLMPSKAVLHEQKAQVLLEIGKTWAAVQAATCATEIQPTWAEAWVTLARAQLNFGEPALAVESARKALQLEAELDRAVTLTGKQRHILHTGLVSAPGFSAGVQAYNQIQLGIYESNNQQLLQMGGRAMVFDPADKPDTAPLYESEGQNLDQAARIFVDFDGKEDLTDEPKNPDSGPAMTESADNGKERRR